MADLRVLQASIPAQTITRMQGIIVGTAKALQLNVNGSILPYRCIDPLVIALGDTVAVDIVEGAKGQGEAWVVGRLASAFRPATGTVKTVPPSSSSITVTGTDGTDYTAYFITSYTPTVGDYVELAWGAAIPYVMGKVGVTPSPPPPPSVIIGPAPVNQSGQSQYAAADSATWSASFGWDNWAGGGGNVYQGGSAYGASNNGAWFYAGSPGELSGRTITRVQFKVPARRAVGSYNSSVTINVYAHTSPYRPGGDVSRTVGPYGVLVLPGFGGGYVDLPTSFGPVLAAGGGISIAGEPYAGFLGRYAQPDSGNLFLDWTR